MVDLSEIGFCEENLYEILATTFIEKDGKPNSYVPNTAAMGIRISMENKIFMNPYPTSTTYKNLKKIPFIIINLVDNIYLYAIAALKDVLFKDKKQTFPQKLYQKSKISEIGINHTHLEKDKAFTEATEVYYLEDSWAIIPCFCDSERTVIKKGPFGKNEISEFELKPLKIDKFRESYNLFNRAENLALESIISATRLKIAKEENNTKQYTSIKKDIEGNFSLIKRFGRNKNALAAKKLVEEYINSLGSIR